MRYAFLFLFCLPAHADSVDDAIKASDAKFQECYLKEVRLNRIRKSGRVKLKLRISDTGEVTEAKIKSSSFGASEGSGFRQCLLSAVPDSFRPVERTGDFEHVLYFAFPEKKK